MDAPTRGSRNPEAVLGDETLAEQGPISVTIVTGFLGAGKTSLVNRLVGARTGIERIGIVVNEAGDIGLDGALLGDASDDVIEIADGCVCCTSQGELLDAIVKLNRAAGNLDRVIVETSGLADPGPVVDALARIAHVLRLDTIVAVVDAAHALDQLDRIKSPEALQQVQLATHVVISKTDLVDAEALDAVRARVLAVNPEAQVIVAVRGDLDPELLLDRFSFGADQADTGHGHHDHEGHDHQHEGHDHGHHEGYGHAHLDVEIFSLELTGDLDAGRFDSWLGGLIMLKSEDLFRIKAIVALAGEDQQQVVHGVQSYVESTAGRAWAPDESRTSRIVIIGKELESDSWRNELERCVAA